ncbi:MAG: hypothetical protein C5B47_04770, partial [Verrucomicrobia bacterium]
MNRLIVLLIGAVLTTVVSLSVHVILLEILHIPYPDGYMQLCPGWALYANFYLSVLAIIWFCQKSTDGLRRWSPLLRCLI